MKFYTKSMIYEIVNSKWNQHNWKIGRQGVLVVRPDPIFAYCFVDFNTGETIAHTSSSFKFDDAFVLKPTGKRTNYKVAMPYTA